MSDSEFWEKINKMIDDVPAAEWDALEERRWLAEMYRAMDFLLKSGSWSAINAFMVQQCLGDGDDYQRSIAILRFLSSAPRDRLAEFEPLLWRVGIALEKKGLDKAHKLRGLK